MSIQLHAVTACTSLRRWTQWILISVRSWIQWFFYFFFVFEHSQALNPFMHLNTAIDFYLCTVACNDSQCLWGDEYNGHLSLYAVEYSDLFITFLFLFVVFKHNEALNPLMQLNSVIDFYVYTAACSDSQYLWGDGHISLRSWIQWLFHFFMCLNIANLWILSCSWILSLTFMSMQLHAMTTSIFEEMNTVWTLTSLRM